MKRQPTRLPDLAYGLQRSTRAPSPPAKALKPSTPLPTKTPVENLDLLSVIHPGDYRSICHLMIFALERQWQKMSRDEQLAAAAEMDRRREAVKDRPGSRLV